MSNKRPVVLMGILLALLAAYFAPQLMRTLEKAPAVTEEKPLPGRNSVSNLELRRQPDGGWSAEFDYFYTGAPKFVFVQIEQASSADDSAEPTVYKIGVRPAVRGSHRASVTLTRPFDEAVRLTKTVDAQIVSGSQVVANQKLAQTIEWPTRAVMEMEREFATSTPEKILDRAIGLIDTEQRARIESAKALLERLAEKDPQNEQVYIEMARVAMKLKWGPEGLHQAESLLASALQIRPESVNAKILLGYVRAHQKRYKEAEALFVDASGAETRNLWLWANWGELLEMQNRQAAAMVKYREAIARPPATDTYDRARRFAFEQLLSLLTERKDMDGIEALHKQRTADYGDGNCYRADYARFMLFHRGDAATAASLARQALDGRCDAAIAREVLGLAHYVAWASAKDGQRDESLRQARVYLAAGPKLFYQLAASESTFGVARQLIGAGERVDQQDNARYTALAYALRAKDAAVARRLLRLGARPDAAVGAEEMPVALLPVVARDFEGIRLMQRSGVDYSKLRYRGMTAVEHARDAQDRQLLDALDPKVGAL